MSRIAEAARNALAHGGTVDSGYLSDLHAVLAAEPSLEGRLPVFPAGRDPKAAIAAKCLDCMYWQRTRITECPIVCCPLWPYRPFTSEVG